MSRSGSVASTRGSSSIGAIQIEPGEFPRVENLPDGLVIASGLPRPRAALIADPAPNALAIGRRPDESVIALTSGLVELLTRDELEAVLAAEMCAIGRLDVALRTTVTACAAGAIGIHNFFREDWKDPRAWLSIGATWPTMVVASRLRRMAHQSCDFGADVMATRITRNPMALLTALQKLRQDPQVVDSGDLDIASLWFEPTPAHQDVRTAERTRMARSLEERIDRVREIALPTGS